MFKSSFLVAAGLAIVVGCQSTEDLGGKSSPNDSMQDNNFFKNTAIANQTEIQSSQLALSQSQNQQVKQLAQHMIDDHTQAQDKLQQLAQNKGAVLPTKLDSMHQDMNDKLQKCSGADFDKMYVQDQIDAHKMTIEQVQKEADNGQDPEAKALAQELLPKLKAHLQMAKQVQQSMMGGNGNNSSGM